MDKLEITGGVRLVGEITISGAKNAALPILTSVLLSAHPLHLRNMPDLADTRLMIDLLTQHGCAVSWDTDQQEVRLCAADVHSTTAPYDIVRKMRASVLVLGPLLARFGCACVSLPGGCSLGARPVDLHIEGLRQMGAQVQLEDGYIHAHAPQGLRGAEIELAFPSVGATENLLMAATLAKGRTVIKNAACEPEISDLIDCLIAMGAQISGRDTSVLSIEGDTIFRAATHSILPDRIETGTYAMAAGVTGGEILLRKTSLSLLGAAIAPLEAMGLTLTAHPDGIFVKGPAQLHPTDVTTAVHPGYATDLQAQIMALMCTAQGTSTIHETIFENRFMHVPELRRLGAQIETHDRMARITGMAHLTGAEVMATDLRASVCLVLAGLMAHGTTTLNRIYHLDRGYEHLERKLQACGARIKRVSDTTDSSTDEA